MARRRISSIWWLSMVGCTLGPSWRRAGSESAALLTSTDGGETWISMDVSVPPDTGMRRTLASPDGRTWRVVDTGSASPYLSVGGTWVDLRSFADPERIDGPVLQTSTDRGLTWQEVDLGTIDPRLAGAHPTPVSPRADGPLGLVFVARAPADGREYLVMTSDLRTWTVEPVLELTGEAEVSIASIAVGTDRIVLTVHAAEDPTSTDRRFTLIATRRR
jgi:hypothetical protein